MRDSGLLHKKEAERPGSIAARVALRRRFVSLGIQSFARTCSLLLHLGGIIAIAVALGHMQPSLHRYALFAYALGIVLALPLIIHASRHARTA